MRRWLPVVAAGSALAVAVLVAWVALAGAPARTATERAEALAAELRCPDCQGLSVADSPTAAAREIRRQVDELVASGAGDEAIRARFVERYGEWILLAPARPLVWVLPGVIVLAGVGGLVAWVARSGRGDPTAGSPPPPPPSAEERRRIREEAEALDA